MSNQRQARRILAYSFTLVLGFATLLAVSACSGPNPFQAARAAESSTTVATQGTGVANNGFIPVDQNLSSCVNTNEQPNCGSPQKGGWHMYLVFTALVLGVGFVMWRISISVRQRDAVVNAEPPTAPPAPSN